MLDNLLTELTAEGWTLGYLRQAGPGWEAQLTKRLGQNDKGYIQEVAFHYADSPAEAIEGALENWPMNLTTETIPFQTPAARPNILTALGLVKPINRRI